MNNNKIAMICLGLIAGVTAAHAGDEIAKANHDEVMRFHVHQTDGDVPVEQAEAAGPHRPTKVLAYPKSGDSYEGQVNEAGLPDGKGICKYNNGKEYEGDWVDGMREGKGVCRYSYRDFSYEGEWVNDVYDGQGTLKEANGDLYVGDFAFGEKNGQGIMTFVDGHSYEGEWDWDKATGEGTLKEKNGNVLFKGMWKKGLGYEGGVNSEGKPHGKGIGTYTNGTIYEGDWVKGEKEGKGTETYLDGRKYIGDWVNGTKFGKGIMIYPNGNKYEGDWNKPRFVLERRGPHGNGVLTDKNGKVLFKGEWVRGAGYEGEVNSQHRPHGKGVGIYVDGSRYEGEWVDGRRKGQGTLVSENGVKCEGEFNDERVKGVLTDKNGKLLFDGEWEYGRGRYEGNSDTGGFANGKGFQVDINGDRFEGNWVHGCMSGEGTITLGEDGLMWRGNFYRRIPQGEGEYKNAAGETWKGTWPPERK